MSTTAPSLTRRRWFQFSLRTLLVLMVVVSLGMGWVMKERRRIAVRREAIIRVGWIWDTVIAQPTWHRTLYGEDEPGFTSVLNRGRDGYTTDAELVYIAGLTQLQGLRLSHTRITDAGLVHLTRLTQLQSLWLGNTNTTDAGLVHLTGMTKLQALGLNDTKATDAGLVHLTRLTQLRYIWLNKTQVTDAGIVTLREALPNCRITR